MFMEFHAAEGGADAESFAAELAAGVTKFSQSHGSRLTTRSTGRVVTLSSVRL